MHIHTPQTQHAQSHSELYRDQLNEQQYEAVTTLHGPVLVIAGAGSGKTRTLVYRVAHLINSGVPPERILLLTFTRKASQEMLRRAGQLLNDSCGRVVGGTFHGIANMLLRRHAASLGYGSSFTIIDRADAEGIINLLKTSLGLTGKDKQFPSKRVLINMISGSVNKSRDLEDLIFAQYSHLSDHFDDILTLRKHYGEFKVNHGLMDYDDLLVNWKRVLEEDAEARRAISARFSYIMVDEYQDTNLIQAEIVRLLASDHNNVMVVGDDSQSIYSFRGADFYNIMRFPKLFAETRIIKLEENYRSIQPILSLTNDIIRNATEKYTKTLFSRLEGDFLPKLYGGADERAEARFVAGRIRQLRQEGTSLEDIAVLFRSGFHSYKLEVELNAQGYDFEKRGGLKLTESAHMKDVLSFMRILANPMDTLSWNRILLQLDKVGPKTARKISSTIVGHDDPVSALAAYPAGSTWKDGIKKLVELFNRLKKESAPGALFELVMQYYEPLFQQIYRDDFPKRQKDLDQLKGIMTSYNDLQSFIDDTTLDPPETETDSAYSGDKLVLSTIHSAKGLEWEVVFVIGLADGRFPHTAAIMGDQWEEERRLFYVAATRAKKQLYLCYPKEMMSSDRRFTRVGMSPFLRELGPGLFQNVGDSPGAMEHVREARVSSPPVIGKSKRPKPSMEDFSPGCKVKHPFFGHGVVKKLTKPRTLDIHFDRHGLKTLHLDYARLEIL
jgi:DNA helicase-2/ATP-dependent DNA helicase PcrA